MSKEEIKELKLQIKAMERVIKGQDLTIAKLVKRLGIHPSEKTIGDALNRLFPIKEIK
jgi:hypothetical protein